MSVGGTGKEGDGEPTRTNPLSPSFLNSGPNVRAAKKAISQEKKDKTEDADYEYNISSLGKLMTAGMNGNKRDSKRRFGAKSSYIRQSIVRYSIPFLNFAFVAPMPQLHVKYPFTPSHGNDNECERRGVGMATRRMGDIVCRTLSTSLGTIRRCGKRGCTVTG
jgi:hypothetical protein